MAQNPVKLQAMNKCYIECMSQLFKILESCDITKAHQFLTETLPNEFGKQLKCKRFSLFCNMMMTQHSWAYSNLFNKNANLILTDKTCAIECEGHIHSARTLGSPPRG